MLAHEGNKGMPKGGQKIFAIVQWQLREKERAHEASKTGPKGGPQKIREMYGPIKALGWAEKLASIQWQLQQWPRPVNAGNTG